MTGVEVPKYSNWSRCQRSRKLLGPEQTLIVVWRVVWFWMRLARRPLCLHLRTIVGDGRAWSEGGGRTREAFLRNYNS